ncbi:MAG: FxsA family protein [Parvularculaceae bacterium]
MIPFLIALFVVGPIAEIYVLLSAGQAFGVWPVVAACLGTAALGGWLIRAQGLAALNQARRDLDDGRAPVNAAIDGVLLALAAPFLMTPGFITDAVGFVLLTPPARRIIAAWLWRWLKKRVDEGRATITIRRY